MDTIPQAMTIGIEDFCIVLRGHVPSARLLHTLMQASGDQLVRVQAVEYREMMAGMGKRKFPVLHTIAHGHFVN